MFPSNSSILLSYFCWLGPIQTLSKLAFFLFVDEIKQPRFVGEIKADYTSV